MKTIKYIGLATVALLAASGLVSCQAEMKDPGLQIPEATYTPNITILELKEAYEGLYNQKIYMPGTWRDANGNRVAKDSSGTLVVVDDNGNPIDATTNGMTSVNTDLGTAWEEATSVEIASGDPVYISGRVVSSDASGNIYKSLVLQDETAAMAFSINQGSLYNEYRLGQEIICDLTGMYIGYYRELMQIGYPGSAYSGTPQLGFMAYDYWLACAQLNGLPDVDDYATVSVNSNYPSDKYYYIAFANFDELNNATTLELQSQLVEFRNVYWQIDEDATDYAPYMESVSRYLVDENGATLTVRNSGYSNFYYELLPEGTGIVRGILSYYGGSWQLLLRDLDDVIISEKGDISDPFEVSDVLEGTFSGLTGWTNGYIVGSVKAGVTSVTSNDDVIFGRDAELDNNVVIAATSTETDITRCVVVELPQNTMVRMQINLIDNPDVYKQRLTIYGTLGTYLGMNGVTGCPGSKNYFLLNGEYVNDGTEMPEPAGSGTEADPYNVAYVAASEGTISDVWVEGYVTGYVIEGDFEESTCEFSNTEVAGSSNYLNQSNILLSAVAPPYCGYENSIPAQLAAASRPTLGLVSNPNIWGAKVKVKCTIRDYLGTRGIRSISEVVVE